MSGGIFASNNDLLTNFGGNPTEAVKNYISFGQFKVDPQIYLMQILI